MTDTNTNNATTEGDSDNAPVTMSALKAVLAEMKAETSKMINGGLESRVKKIVEPILSSIKPKDEPKAEENETESDAPKGESVEMRKLRTMVEAERKRNEEFRKEIEASKAEAAKRDRIAKLRELITDPKHNFADADVTLDHALARLKVDDAGQFFAEGADGSVVSAADFIAALPTTKPTLLKASGKNGNGDAPAGRRAEAKADSYDFTKKAAANMENALKGVMFS